MVKLFKTTLVFLMLGGSLVGYCCSCSDDHGQYGEIQERFREIMYNDFKHTELDTWDLQHAQVVLNYADSDGISALIVASDYGRLEMVKRFIAHGANIHQHDTHGDTALFYAAKNGHIEVVRHLVEHGAEINHVNEIKHTVLIEASIRGHMQVVQYLVEHKANINHFNDDGVSAVGFAIANNHEDIGKYLIEHGASLQYEPFSFNHFDILLLALRNENIALAKYLIQHGANVNVIEEGYEKLTPSMVYAINLKNVKLVDMLVKHGASMTAYNLNTWVRYAIGNDDLEMTKYFVEHGADVKCENIDDDPQKYTDAHNTCGNFELVQYLNTQGADINKIFTHKVMHCKHFIDQHLKIVEYLIEHGLNDQQAIILAIDANNLQVVKHLIDRGTKIDKEKETEIVISVVERHDNLEMLQYLEKQGLKLDVLDEKQNSLLMLAMRANHREIAKYLIERGADITHVNSVGEGIISHDWYKNRYLNDVQMLQLLSRHGMKFSHEVLYNILLRACRYVNLDVIKYLVEIYKIDIKQFASSEFALEDVVYACRDNEIGNVMAVIQYLVEHGADVNHGNPLLDAVEKNNLDIIQYLIAHGAKMPNSPKYLFTIDVDSHRYDTTDFNTVKYLIDHGMPNSPKYLLHAASHSLDMVEYFVKHGADIKTYANDVLFIGAYNGRMDVVQYAIEQGANIHIERNGVNILYEAARGGNLRLVKYFINRGVSMYYEKTSALFAAAMHGQLEIVKYFVEHVKDLDINYEGRIAQSTGTALMYAVALAHNPDDNVPVIDYLLRHGANIDYVDMRTGYTALAAAISAGNANIALYLIDRGANVNTVYSDGPILFSAWYQTASHVAVLSLIEHGADVNCEKNGMTFLSTVSASKNATYPIVVSLVEHGADIKKKNADGTTALDIAEKNGNKEIVEYLRSQYKSS